MTNLAVDSKSINFNDSINEGLLRHRIIYLDSEVNSESASRISKQLMLLAAGDDQRDITMYINSPGGSITDGMAIYDTMQLILPEIRTIAIGMAASMGQFLLSSGTRGKRFITPNARVLMHQPSGGVGGTATDVRIGAELLLDMKLRLSKLTAAQTGQTLELILEDNEHDKWFTADEALEYGFVDAVIEDVNVIKAGGR
ncbi:MAG: ATP-dependent Clp protease proteolytic subunit [Candidatus Ancillula trichonymphae]|jgi:ATP-dependent Clp protease protease subunit|nr:ATP-dependent Clp protease proteolytic subunit [Candidatus Ancillula trichonymphae]